MLLYNPGVCHLWNNRVRPLMFSATSELLKKSWTSPWDKLTAADRQHGWRRWCYLHVWTQICVSLTFMLLISRWGESSRRGCEIAFSTWTVSPGGLQGCLLWVSLQTGPEHTATDQKSRETCPPFRTPWAPDWDITADKNCPNSSPLEGATDQWTPKLNRNTLFPQSPSLTEMF